MSVEYNFENKRVLITGAGRGTGRVMAKAFVQAKAAKVFALSKTKEHLDTLVAEEPRITPIHCDLDDLHATRDAVVGLGPIDILVNNAAVGFEELLVDMTTEHFDKQVNVNLKAPLLISKLIAKGMIARKEGGHIVNISSTAAKTGVERTTAHSATKGGVEAATRTMAHELGKHNIIVNCVCPGLIATEMTANWHGDSTYMERYIQATPLGRVAQPEDIVNVVMFLCTDKATMVHGQTIVVSGGWLSI